MTAQSPQTQVRCFFEHEPGTSLLRRGFVEGLGTLLLAAAATGAAAMARQAALEPTIGVIISALATAAALVALIVAFGPVSGAHFNPLISVLQWLAGERGRRCAVVYCACQFAGALLGASITVLWVTKIGHSTGSEPPLARLLVSELACSAALMIIVLSCARSTNTTTAPFAVGAWLASAILASPSGSIANPAIAIASLIGADSRESVVRALLVVCAELSGALIALLAMSIAYPRPRIHRSIATSGASPSSAPNLLKIS